MNSTVGVHWAAHFTNFQGIPFLIEKEIHDVKVVLLHGTIFNAALLCVVHGGKSKELSGILTRKEVSLKLKGKVYMTCARSAMVNGSEVRHGQ